VLSKYTVLVLTTTSTRDAVSLIVYPAGAASLASATRPPPSDAWKAKAAPGAPPAAKKPKGRAKLPLRLATTPLVLEDSTCPSGNATPLAARMRTLACTRYGDGSSAPPAVRGHSKTVGTTDGCGDGARLSVGGGEGVALGSGVGTGVADGSNVGTGVGCSEGTGVGWRVGTGVGKGVGSGVGTGVGTGVGVRVGTGVGCKVGTGVGLRVGTGVGCKVGTGVG